MHFLYTQLTWLLLNSSVNECETKSFKINDNLLCVVVSNAFFFGRFRLVRVQRFDELLIKVCVYA